MHEPRALDTLTQSRLHAWRKCQRYHRLRYIDGWRSATVSEPMQFGILIHRALEAWWNGYTETCDSSVDSFEQIKVTEMMKAYGPLGWPDRSDFDVLAIEYPVRFPLVNPDTMQPSKTYESATVIDLILRRRSTGAVVLVEHKTTGADFSDDAAAYWNRLAMDSQLSIEVVGAEAAGFQVERIIYDVIARPQLRPKKATPEEERRITKAGKLDARQRDTDETPEEFRARLAADIASRPERYFGRREIARLESELRDGMLDVWQEAKAMRAAEVAGRHPRNPDACFQMGTCVFYDVCANGAPLEGSTMFTRSDDRHPELTRAFAALEVSR